MMRLEIICSSESANSVRKLRRFYVGLMFVEVTTVPLSQDLSDTSRAETRARDLT